MNYLEELNPPQREAATHQDGPLLIIAGAGTGKTKTVTHRIIHLINQGISPANILAITFTNKAAKEMRERVESLLKETSVAEHPGISEFSRESKPFISTFHSLGVRILKEKGELIGVQRHFSILDKSGTLSVVKEIIKAQGLDPKQFAPEKLLWTISKQKGNLVTAEKYAETAGSKYPASILSSLWLAYEKEMQKQKALDFDDLILKTVLLLKRNEEVRKHYQNKWKYIHIDEYQDTNTSQYELAKLLVGENKNVCAVGDGDQCIYSWRGADFKNILNFEKDYSGAKTILLEQNYRSTQTILAVANDIIKKNKIRRDKKLFTENIEGEQISIFDAVDEGDEALFVAHKTQELIKAGTKPKDIAVLYRANFQSRALEEAFLSEKLPYQVLGVKFFDRKEIKDILAFIRAGLNPDNLHDIKRVVNVPPRGIGKVTLAKMFAGEESTLTPAMRARVEKFRNMLTSIKETALNKKTSELIKFVMQETGIEESLKAGTDDDKERLENTRELVTLASKYDVLSPEEGVEQLLTDAALTTDQDSLEKVENAVKLMTVHASKGLEFPVVFVTGLEDDLFPHKKMGEGKKTEAENEEERRLFYVAITRAKKKLFLSYTSFRTIYGSKQVNVPSEFITDIDDAFIKQEERTARTMYLD